MKARILSLFAFLTLLLSCYHNEEGIMEFENDCVGTYRVAWLISSDGSKRIDGLQKICDGEDVVLEALLNWDGDSIDMTHRWENDLLTHELHIKNNQVLLADKYDYDSYGHELNSYSYLPSENIFVQKIYTNYYDEKGNWMKQTREDVLGQIEEEKLMTYENGELFSEKHDYLTYYYTYDSLGRMKTKKQSHDNVDHVMTWKYEYIENNLSEIQRIDEWGKDGPSILSEWESFEYNNENQLEKHLMGMGHDTDLFYQYEYFEYDELPEHIKNLFKL